MNKYFNFILLSIILVLSVRSRNIQNSILISAMRKNGGWIYLDRITLDKGQASLSLNVDIISIRKDANSHK